MALIDHLPVVTPDYTTAKITKSANFDLPVAGGYKQIINETDGDNDKVVTMVTTPKATVTIRFTGVDQTEANTLSDFYYNSTKAYGMARSYIWQHSQTLEEYTVKNISEYTETAVVKSYGKYDISFTVKILGTPV